MNCFKVALSENIVYQAFVALYLNKTRFTADRIYAFNAKVF